MNRKKILLTVCAMAVILPIVAGCDQNMEEVHSIQHQEQLQGDGEPCTESAGCDQGEEEAPHIQQREYLQGTVPPCTESARWGYHPCKPPPSDNLNESNAHSSSIPFLHESLYELMDGHGKRNGRINAETHLMFRGILLPGTERCGDVIPFMPQRYSSASLKRSASINPAILFPCYADFTVHDYIIGAGQKTLTLMLDVESFRKERPSESWFTEKEKEMKARIESKYSGREVILGIGPTWMSSYEGWQVTYRWYLERADDAEVVAVSYRKRDYIRAFGTLTPEQLARLEYPLADFEREVVAGHNKFKTETGGRIGTAPGLPTLITDANDLHSYYVNELRAYENLTATPVLPPPVPGENDPFQPGTNIGDPPTSGDATAAVPGAPDDTTTDTPTPTGTSTNTPTSTVTTTPTNTPTLTPTSTATAIPEPEPEPTDTPTATATETPESEPTDTPTHTPSATATATNTATATATSIPELEPEPTDTPTATPTDTPTETPTPELEPTDTPTPTATSTVTATNTPTFTPTATETPTATPTPSPTATPESEDDGQGGGSAVSGQARRLRHIDSISDGL